MSESATPFAARRDGLAVAVRLVPKSSSDTIEGVERDASGKAWLKVRVGAPPEKGKANARLIKLLAKEWGLSPSRLSIATGARARRKIVLIEGEGETLRETLEKTFETTL